MRSISLAERDRRQESAFRWVVNTFGQGPAESVPEQGTRFLEEALEAAQAAGVSVDMANRLMQRVFSKPKGELSKEIGQAGLCLLTLAESAGISADAHEAVEVNTVRSRPAGFYHQRYAMKIKDGVVSFA